MRQISAQLLDPDSLLELEAGHRLEIVVGDRTIAEIVPYKEAANSSTVPVQGTRDEAERLAAVDRLVALMDRGYDLGRLKITDRDELYDRD